MCYIFFPFFGSVFLRLPLPGGKKRLSRASLEALKAHRAAARDTAAARVDVAAAPISHWDWDCGCGRLEECTVRVDCCC